MSWLIAMTIAPLFCIMFLKTDVVAEGEEVDPYKGILFKLYRGFLQLCIRRRWLTVAVVGALMAWALLAFGYLEDSFFPDSTTPQMLVHYWLPEGTDIRRTSEDLTKIESYIKQQPGVVDVVTFVGGGAPRYTLVYSPEKEYDSYGMLMVNVDDYRIISDLMKNVRAYLESNYVDANPKLEKIMLGPGGGYKIEARFSGPDPDKLRELSDQAKLILLDDGGAIGVRDDWRERVKIIRPLFSDPPAQRAGITRADVAKALQTAFSGTQVGIYREGDDLLPIMSRAPWNERDDVANINSIQIWSRAFDQVVPLRQVTTGIKTTWEDAIIQRKDKKRTITTQADQRTGNASVVFARVKPLIEAIPLPIGYEFEWGGEYEDSKEAQAGLAANIPVTFLLMVLVVIVLFNALRQPLIIWLTVPLALIGVTFGLLVTGEPFGFMAILGFLSLAGMLIKNAIVLIDEIDTQKKAEPDLLKAILDSSVSRMRPVLMATVTTVLGMIPLLADVFFKAMAVTIMAGLSFATVLTLIFVPVLYSIFFRSKTC